MPINAGGDCNGCASLFQLSTPGKAGCKLGLRPAKTHHIMSTVVDRRTWVPLLLLLYAGSVFPANPLFESDAKKLGSYESAGFSFSQYLCGVKSSGPDALIKQCPAYRELFSVLSEDIHNRFQKLPSPEIKKDTEFFRTQWLESKDSRFQLTALVLRLDRMPALANTCGEMRLIFRLLRQYQDGSKRYESYLPMTVMAVVPLPFVSRCERYVSQSNPRWESLLQTAATQRNIRLEINLLGLRVPAPILPDSTGYAEYLMRVFAFDRTKGTLQVLPLENTPDVDKISSHPALRKDFVAWVKAVENRAALQSGHFQLPERFLAAVVVSVSPFGLQRLANAPYSRILVGENISPALLTRLNRSSCQGCHQTGSDAGFHFLGSNLSKSFVYNRTALPASRHFWAEQEWREKFVAHYRRTLTSLARPIPGRTDGKSGISGDTCTVGEVFPCREGFVCRQLWQNSKFPELQTGYCQKNPMTIAGEPCLLGNWKEDGEFGAGLSDVITTACFELAQCLPQSIGFPGGICGVGCLEKKMEGTVCQRVPALQNFTECTTSGHGLSACFKKASTRALLRGCTIDIPCRPDYVCAQVVHAGGSRFGGACVPPYFLPQLNLSIAASKEMKGLSREKQVHRSRRSSVKPMVDGATAAPKSELAR